MDKIVHMKKIILAAALILSPLFYSVALGCSCPNIGDYLLISRKYISVNWLNSGVGKSNTN